MADAKISQLTALGSFASGDLIPMVDDPSGVPETKKATIDQVKNFVIAEAPTQSFKNKIINGNFDLWQRGTSVTGVTDGQYLADRWYHIRGGSTADVSRQSFTLGQTGVPNEPSYFHRTVVSSVAGSGNYIALRQNVESVRTLAGQTATLSFWAKADASRNIAVEFEQRFGSGGSPSSYVISIGVTTFALNTSWQKFSTTVSVPSIFGKTLGTDNNDSIGLLFWLDAGSSYDSRTNSLGQQSGTFDIAQVQLEAGSVATPFEVRPPGLEFDLCQRYFQLYTLSQEYVDGFNKSFLYRPYTLPTAMRVLPSASVFSQFTYYSGGGAANFTPTLGVYSTHTFTIFGSNLTNCNGFIAGTTALSAEL